MPVPRAARGGVGAGDAGRRSAQRLGENDAWLAATALTIDADVVGADGAAFERLGRTYLRFA